MATSKQRTFTVIGVLTAVVTFVAWLTSGPVAALFTAPFAFVALCGLVPAIWRVTKWMEGDKSQKSTRT